MLPEPGADVDSLSPASLRQIALGAALTKSEARWIAHSGLGAGMPDQEHTASRASVERAGADDALKAAGPRAHSPEPISNERLSILHLAAS